MAKLPDDRTTAGLRDYLCRRPDWRYRLAVEYASCRRTVRPLQCSLVEQCVALIRQRAQDPSRPTRGRQPCDRQSIDLGPLIVANELYSNAGYAELKLELEARILAGQMDAQLAQATGLPEEVCQCYEQVFFDIRHRLDCVDYIMCEVIGCSHVENDDPGTQARQSLYKLAYCAGSQAIEEILAVRRLLASNTAETYRRLVRQHLVDNSTLLGLLTAERLQPFGIAANELLAGLLEVPLDLPSSAQAPGDTRSEPVAASCEPETTQAVLRAAG